MKELQKNPSLKRSAQARLYTVVIIGFVLFICSAYKGACFQGKPLSAPLLIDTIRDETMIEVLTSQQLVVSDAVRNKTGKRIKFKSGLKDCFKIIKYDSLSVQVETKWQPSARYGVTAAGFFKKDDPEYKRLDSLLLSINREAKRKKR